MGSRITTLLRSLQCHSPVTGTRGDSPRVRLLHARGKSVPGHFASAPGASVAATDLYVSCAASTWRSLAHWTARTAAQVAYRRSPCCGPNQEEEGSNILCKCPLDSSIICFTISSVAFDSGEADFSR